MKENTTLGLANDLFQLMKKLPRPKIKHSARVGLTQSEYELLMILVMNFGVDKNACSISEISDLLQITPAGVTHLINPLEESGCVKRLPDPKDRRVVLIGLTAKGIRIAEELIAEVQKKLSGLVGYLGEQDSKTLIRLLSRTVEYLISTG